MMKIERTVFSLHEHSQLLDTIQDELGLFRERQAEASSQRKKIRSLLLLSLDETSIEKGYFSKNGRFPESFSVGISLTWKVSQ